MTAGAEGMSRLAQEIAALALSYERRGVVTVRRVSAGPMAGTAESWLVVLYQSAEIVDGQQLVGFGLVDADEVYASASNAELAAAARDMYAFTLEEPPGTELEDDNVPREAIAWWKGLEHWTPESGPPGEGQAATRTYWRNDLKRLHMDRSPRGG
jgi:hypothetical protein